MVDLDDSYGGSDDSSKDNKGNRKEGSSNSSSSGSSSNPSSTSNSGGSPSAVRSEVDVDERVSNSSVSDTSEMWAEKYGDLSYDIESGKPLQTYIERQEEECREFYQNMAEMAVDIAEEGAQKFTLAHHAMIMNMAHNKAGIKETLVEEFNMGDGKAIETTNKICKNAGEYKCFIKVMNKITEDGLEVMDLEGMV